MEYSRKNSYFNTFSLYSFILLNKFEIMDEEVPVRKTAEEWKKIGNDAFTKKDYHAAIQAYTEAISEKADDHSFYSNRAICYYNLQNYIECINDCNMCIKMSPKFTKAYRRKSMAQIETLKFDDAVASLAAAYNIDKDLAISRELEAAESYKSNWERYKNYTAKDEFSEALSCINYLFSKIPSNENIKLMKV